MVDEGFGRGDPHVRLAQLAGALLRECRYLVGVQEHTAGMSVEDGKKAAIAAIEQAGGSVKTLVAKAEAT